MLMGVRKDTRFGVAGSGWLWWLSRHLGGVISEERGTREVRWGTVSLINKDAKKRPSSSEHRCCLQYQPKAARAAAHPCKKCVFRWVKGRRSVDRFGLEIYTHIDALIRSGAASAFDWQVVGYWAHCQTLSCTHCSTGLAIEKSASLISSSCH